MLAQNILAAALSNSTRSSYRSAVNHIAKFHEKQASKLVFPLSADTLCLWMAYSIDKLKYPSIRNYLHGIATTQLELGYPNPLTQSPLVWRMFKAVKRLQGAKVVRKRLPITVSILSQIDSFFDAKHELDLCMRAAMWLGTCGLLRAGEFVTKPTTKYSLKLQHLTFHDVNNNILDPHNLKHNEIPHYMSLRLDQSKTDPFRQACLLTYIVVINDFHDNHCLLVSTVKH